MLNVAQSTIAQAVYANSQGCNFARVVTELETLVSRLCARSLRTRWDYEDVVIFDVDETRIVLGWSEDRTDDLPVCLLVSVGPLPDSPQSGTDPKHEILCSRLLERIQHRYPPEAVLWRQLPLAIEADLVDALIDCLPPLTDALGGQAPEADAKEAAPATTAIVPVAGVHTAANDRPDLPRQDNLRLAQVRSALYTPDEMEAVESPQMRLAAQALNATLIMVWMPLGAAVMTYSLLKGERIGFSARMMAVTGTVVGLSQSPFAQHVASLAGV